MISMASMPRPWRTFMGARIMIVMRHAETRKRRTTCVTASPSAARSPATAIAPILAILLTIASNSHVVAQNSGRSAIACDAFARDYAANASRRGQVLGGAATGSLLGLGIGALAGASGVGAAVGATVGFIGGGARRHSDAQRMYNVAYQDCMAGRIR